MDISQYNFYCFHDSDYLHFIHIEYEFYVWFMCFDWCLAMCFERWFRATTLFLLACSFIIICEVVNLLHFHLCSLLISLLIVDICLFSSTSSTSVAELTIVYLLTFNTIFSSKSNHPHIFLSPIYSPPIINFSHFPIFSSCSFSTISLYFML